VPAQAVNPSLLSHLSRKAFGLGFPLALALVLTLPAAHGSSPSCPKGDQRDPGWQWRPEMDRCEGIRRTKPIAADGLRLTSYTIGLASPRKDRRGGSVFVLQVPVLPEGRREPLVAVEAWKANYRMEPRRLEATRQGWKHFSWGAAVIQGQGITADQLRATALLRTPGDTDQWLPVLLGPASGYNLVISSNASLRVSSVRLLGPNKEKVKDCLTRPALLDQDLPCSWNAAGLKAGPYRLLVRNEAGDTLLDETLRHDPRWLTP